MEYPRAVPVAIFLLVIAITVVSIVAIERGEVRSERAELARQAQSMSSAIERRVIVTTSNLRAGAALLSTQPNFDVDLFRRFTEGLHLGEEYQGTDGIGWAPVITDKDVASFEERLSKDNAVTLSVTPSLGAVPRRQLVPILYLRPDTVRNRRALGFDMYSEPVRRAAMVEATRTTEPTASGKVVLIQEGSGRNPGFLIYVPVFDAERDARRLLGFIYSPLNAAQFVSSADSLAGGKYYPSRLYDLNGGKRELLVQMHGWQDGNTIIERHINLANRPMILAMQRPYHGRLSAMSMATLLFGLAVASLSMLVALLLTQQAVEDGRRLDWFEEQNSIRNSLTRELNHRVKNTLANVLSLVSLTRRRSSSLDEFAEGLDGRIRALSATHDLLTQSEWGATPIRSVVEVELAPYARGTEQQVSLSGPDVELAPNDTLSLGLALHELATNAAKYGSLSSEDGRVAVSWSLVEDTLARIEWVESGGAVVSQPNTRGFGIDLIEKIVAHELRHPVELVFDPRGVRCTLLVPIREPSEFALRRVSKVQGAGDR